MISISKNRKGKATSVRMPTVWASSLRCRLPRKRSCARSGSGIGKSRRSLTAGEVMAERPGISGFCWLHRWRRVFPGRLCEWVLGARRLAGGAAAGARSRSACGVPCLGCARVCLFCQSGRVATLSGTVPCQLPDGGEYERAAPLCEGARKPDTLRPDYAFVRPDAAGRRGRLRPDDRSPCAARGQSVVDGDFIPPCPCVAVGRRAARGERAHADGCRLPRPSTHTVPAFAGRSANGGDGEISRRAPLHHCVRFCFFVHAFSREGRPPTTVVNNG